MYRDVAQWLAIRHQILVQGVPIHRIARETGISRKTIRKMREQPLPLPYGVRFPHSPKLGPHTTSAQQVIDENTTPPLSAHRSIKSIYERICDEAFCGGHGALRDHARLVVPAGKQVWGYIYNLLTSLEKTRAIEFLSQLFQAGSPVILAARAEELFRKASRAVDATAEIARQPEARQVAFEWMRAVLQKDISPDVLAREVGDVSGLEALLYRLYEGRLSDRNRSMTVIAHGHGLSSSMICSFLGIDKKTHRRYLSAFKEKGQAGLFSRKIVTHKSDSEAIKQAVFRILHEPPSKYGINRTTWIMADLSRILRETGHPVCAKVIRKITKAAGYRWRKARTVLTSSDPEYTAKLERIHFILSRLRSDEAFFSIDEFGPFAVKMKPGRALCAPGEQRVVPQWQKSRGCLIITAALELFGNQVTHFYSLKKNTGEMIRMMELLVERYYDRRKLYLSWDGASWHISKRLYQRIEEHNMAVLGGPTVETAPLPSGAQFLNVIESVFSGMARSIIHNSDYKTLDETKAVIDRYFADRNKQFLRHPRRAGKKIWGMEREAAVFSAANNCKDPRYR
jgi:transposase